MIYVSDRNAERSSDRFRRDSTGQRQRAEAGEIRAGREQRAEREATAFVGGQKRATGTTQRFTLDPHPGSRRLTLLLSTVGRRMELHPSLRSPTSARKSLVGNSQIAPARRYASSKCFQPATEKKQ